MVLHKRKVKNLFPVSVAAIFLLLSYTIISSVFLKQFFKKYGYIFLTNIKVKAKRYLVRFSDVRFYENVFPHTSFSFFNIPLKFTSFTKIYLNLWLHSPCTRRFLVGQLKKMKTRKSFLEQIFFIKYLFHKQLKFAQNFAILKW